jgi:hypothetical protein
LSISLCTLLHFDARADFKEREAGKRKKSVVLAALCRMCLYNAKEGKYAKPNEHHRAKDTADKRRATALDDEQTDNDDNVSGTT